ncbi:MAG: hemerythrin family protein [Gammaproteobacteria bacterium]|nr:hemerythrin family protein [Gammaproteobacteria bacterium]
MQRKKSVLQKISFYSAIISFILSITSVIFLYLRVEEFGMENPISASLLASSFFFVSVGVVLMVIAKANLPSFKVGNNN